MGRPWSWTAALRSRFFSQRGSIDDSPRPSVDPLKGPIRYEARPTRMFGAYTLWASYANGSHAQIGHGTPQACLADADRLNAELGLREMAEGRPSHLRSVTSTRGILQKADPARWSEHRFGLPSDRWHALGERAFWVTGAGTGYGQALATALAGAGATVFISGRRPEKLALTVQAAAKLGIPAARLVPLVCDVTSPDQVDAVAATIRERTDHLHGLVNNAALPCSSAASNPLSDLSPTRWSDLIATNVTGPWLVTRAILPHMVKRAVRVLFISSEAGWAFTPGVGPYNVTKAALNNLGASFAAECAASHPRGDIQINVLVPGEARTEMNQGSSDSPYAMVSMALALLSHPPEGPNGRFFHRDGRHLSFAYAAPYERDVLNPGLGDTRLG
jgi:NAD(P)-dependent dehydrogenase (short-subunit alcohol dehydrogenase family)